MDITYPPDLLPKSDEPADVVICNGNCDQAPPCPACTIIRAPDIETLSS